MTSPTTEFELVFEGISDENTDALRLVKGIFLCDLNLTVERAQEILSSAPVTLIRSADERQLEAYRKKLAQAGAKVLVVGPPSAAESKTNGSGTNGSQPSSPSAEEVLAEIELDLSAHLEKPKPRPRVYELSLDDGGESADADVVPADESASSVDDSLHIAPDESKSVKTGDSLALDDVAALLDESEKSLQADAAPAPVRPTLQPEAPKDEPKSSPSLTPPETSVLELELESAPAAAEQAPAAKTSPKAPDEGNAESSGKSALSLSDEDPAPPATSSGSLDLTLEPVTHVEPEYTPRFKMEEESFEDDLAPAPVESIFPKQEAAPAPITMAPTAAKADAPATKATPSQPPTASTPALASVPPLATIASDKAEKPKTEPPAPAPEATAAPAPTEEKPAARAAKKRKKLPVELVVPIIVGGVALGAANFMYFSKSSNELNEKEIMKLVPAEIKKEKTEPASAGQSETKALTSPVAIRSFVITAAESNGAVSGRIDFENDDLSSIFIAISGPPSRELTNEEIARGKPRAPWLYKAEINGLQFHSQADGILVGKGLAPAFLDYNQQRIRIALPVTVTVEVLLNYSAINVKYDMLLGYEQEPDAPISVERNSDGTFKVAVHGELRAKPSAQPTSAPKVKTDEKPDK